MGDLSAGQVRDPAGLVRFTRALLMVIALMAGLISTATLLNRDESLTADPVTLWIVLVILPACCFVLAVHPRPLATCPTWFVALVLPLAVIWVATWALLALGNSTSAAQLFFGLPVFLAAYQLRLPFALLIAANALAAIGVIALAPGDLNVGLHALLFATISLLGITITFAWMRDSLQNLVEQLRAQAEHDHLTGLVSRRHFERVLDREVERQLKKHGLPGCALLSR